MFAQAQENRQLGKSTDGLSLDSASGMFNNLILKDIRPLN